MLELNKVNKYFNKGKKNELHVINDTNVNMELNGLIALLGPSGCGKTTLLNCIGGLDSIKSGSIYLNDLKISSKCSSRVDKIRNLNIGYIFQDYKLIDNLTVYDNIALVLTMIGIKDKKEIKKRVEYVLDKVGMLRYKYRPASMLSGGERQRVGIARAIVKDPNIILADEPTGNLDSKNSLEIMKIIKSISRDKLVILVTHEQNLAKFYATRILEIKDGTIVNDYINEHNNTLDYEIDNTFYLKDFKNIEKIDKDNTDINIYSDNKENIKLDIIIKNGNLYIKNKTNNKIEVIDDNSNIEIINDHYQTIKKSDIDKYDFDFEEIINNKYKKKYSSIFNIFTLITNGFKKVFGFSALKKILLIGFVLSGMFIMYAVSSIAANYNIKDEYFVTTNKNYLIINMNKVNVNKYLEYEKENKIEYLLPGNSLVTFNLKYLDYYQTRNSIDKLTGSLASINMINKDNLLYGRMPENEYEVVLDELTINNLFNKSDIVKMAGIIKQEDLINRYISLPNMNDFKIVGIVNTNSPSIYTYNSMFSNIISNSVNIDSGESTNIVDYNLFKDTIKLKKGRYPTNDYETIVTEDNIDSMPINKQIDTKINNTKLTVVGYYSSIYDYKYLLVNTNTIKYNNISNNKNIIVYTKDKETILNEFKNKDLNIKDSYQNSKEMYIKSNALNTKNTLIVSGIIIAISLIEIFFMIRSSFLSRIKEVGIYRAIGVKKSDIYKMFFGEIFAITTLASVPGIILMAYLLYLASKIKYIASAICVTPILVILTICFIYIFNLLIGFIPVFNTIRKRPAQILARHDLD